MLQNLQILGKTWMRIKCVMHIYMILTYTKNYLVSIFRLDAGCGERAVPVYLIDCGFDSYSILNI